MKWLWAVTSDGGGYSRSLKCRQRAKTTNIYWRTLLPACCPRLSTAVDSFCRITTPQTDATHTVITLKTHFLGNDLQCKCTTECHAYCSPLSDYTRWVKTTNTLDFRYHNFGKCRPIYKILSLSDSWGNFVHVYHKDSPPHLKCVSTLLCQSWKLQFLLISMSYCMWDLRIILQDMKPPQRLGSESCDYKIWKTMQQCLEEE